MTEKILRDFFLGSASPESLSADIGGPEVEGQVRRYHISDMDEGFGVEPEHLVRVCDAFLEGKLSDEQLRTIGFCLIASDTFNWDGDTDAGERITSVAHDWAAPEINFPITSENVRRWRKYLISGVYELGQARSSREP
jgi:hypothetical protein